MRIIPNHFAITGKSALVETSSSIGRRRWDLCILLNGPVKCLCCQAPWTWRSGDGKTRFASYIIVAALTENIQCSHFNAASWSNYEVFSRCIALTAPLLPPDHVTPLSCSIPVAFTLSCLPLELQLHRKAACFHDGFFKEAKACGRRTQ